MYEKVFDSSVNSVSWAPHEFGLSLAVGSSDGRIAVISYQENAWRENVFEGHTGGVNAVSWAPAVAAGSIFGGSSTKVDSPVRFASGGCDGRVKIWKHDNGSWFEELYLVDQKSAQSKWIRDVAWAPSIGMSTSTIASSGDDQSVVIWTEKPGSQGEWLAMEKLVFDQKVWRLAWSVMGNILAISHGDGAENRVSLWKETLDGKWKNLSSMDEAQALNQTESE